VKANVYVTLKEEVLDPQGDAVRRALTALGFEGVRSVRVGKLIELDIDASDREQAVTDLRRMGEQLLANTVIEDFEVELEDD
jgi:phosphoribosylformylglycinamidine synthase